MDCELFRLLIQRYYDGELSYTEAVEYESHRKKCPECRMMDAEFAKVFEVLGNIPLYEPSEEFNTVVLDGVDLTGFRRRRAAGIVRDLQSIWYRVPFPVRAVSTVALAFSLALVIFRPLFLFVAGGISRGLVLLKGLSDIAAHLIENISEVISSLGSFKTYEVAFQTLLRTARLVLDVLPTRDIVSVAFMFILIVIAAFAMRKQIKSKGETNVFIS